LNPKAARSAASNAALRSLFDHLLWPTSSRHPTIADEDDNHRTLTLVGDDETDAGKGLIGWNAPLARALRGSTVGDLRRVTLPAGEKEYEVMSVTYPSG
jgi:hypothetical protein